jgi:hypothetical protein
VIVGAGRHPDLLAFGLDGKIPVAVPLSESPATVPEKLVTQPADFCHDTVTVADPARRAPRPLLLEMSEIPTYATSASTTVPAPATSSSLLL